VSDTIRVITSCTNRKAIAAPAGLETAKLPELQSPTTVVAAERLYAGGQHRRLMAGVDMLRAHRPVEVWVISAKVGLVSGETQLAPYNESFTSLSRETLRERADALAIPSDVRRLIARPAALMLMLLGNDYFDAARLDSSAVWGGPAVAFVSPSRAIEFPADPLLRVVPVSQATAKAWSLPLTLLKGELVQRILIALAEGVAPRALVGLEEDVLTPLLSPHGEPVLC